MHGDFSRRRSELGRQYKGVLMQQGRVQLDADWNTQQDLHDHRVEIEAIDTIGDAGAPRAHAGFAITTPGGQLRIGPGRFYLDGYALENEALRSINAQPYAPAVVAPPQAGAYLVYLEAFERLVTAVEDPEIREVALGGPDTGVRSQVVWQVRLQRLGNANPNIAVTAGDAALAALRAPLTGRMRAQAQPVLDPGRPCLVPSEARYRRLDNLLYRVEVHAAPNGTQAGATFKWSRDNGSVTSAVQVIAGAVLTLSETARDDLVRFEQGTWVEVIDDVMALEAGVGVLRQVAQPVDHDRRQITLDQPVPGLDAHAHPRVRLWNQTGNVPAGVALGAGNWVDLEGGIQVRFDNGTYRPGDHWLIPARTAPGGPDGLVRERTGDIEWPTQAGAPVAQLRTGTLHHFAALAIVDQVNGVWTLRHDLRPIFPPLTAITARDVSYDNSAGLLNDPPTVQDAIEELARRGSGGCTIVMRPGDDLAARFAEIPNGGSARVCFPPGRFQVAAPVVVRKLGHLVISGVGPGSSVEVAGGESALRFEGCGSVTVRDLALVSGAGQGAARANLGGALHFQGTDDVVVERVRVETRSLTDTECTGITVRTARTARVTGCEVRVGDLQHGLLFVDVGRVVAEDNIIAVAAGAARIPWVTRMADRQALGRLVNEMIREARLGPTRAGAAGREEVVSGQFTVNFVTPSALRGRWAALLRASPPTAAQVGSDRELLRYLEYLARDLLRGEGVVAGYRELRGWFQNLMRNERAAGSRGISVVGANAPEVRVARNRIEQFAAGVHVGVSDHRAGQVARRSAGRVWIEDNAIDLWINGDTTRTRFGIYVGNISFLRVIGNDIDYGRSTGVPSTRITEGIRIYGVLERMVMVRENRISNATAGIRFVPTLLRTRPQWVLTDNLCPSNPPVRFGDAARGISESQVAPLVRGEEHNVGP